MSTLHSPRWHRIAALRPQLSPQVRVRRQQVRGDRWWVLTTGRGGRSVRLNATAYALAGRLDGQHTVQQLWDWQLARPDDPATQDELIDMLAQLHEAALLQFDRTADFDLLLPHLDRVAAPHKGRSLLAWRVPLLDPSGCLSGCQWIARTLFSRTAFMVWATSVGLLMTLLMQHAPTLWAHGERWLTTPRYALLAAVLYVPIKLLHELAHGLAVSRWGGTVREAGVTLLLGMPVPYVDASASSAFVSRWQRIAVGAAGLMAELTLAAIALPLWLWLDDGLARDAAFVTLVIAGVSTLVFNANPLQRLDGYYIATDLLELPNLALRSRAWWLDLFQRRLLRLRGPEPMVLARGEAPWLAAYAPLSWLCSVVIAATAVAWLGHLSLALGLTCGALLAWQMMLRPLAQLLGRLRRSALSSDDSQRRWRCVAWGGAAAVSVALLLPLPQRLLASGVVWPAEQAQLRASEDGFIAAIVASDGESVAVGSLVLKLTNPSLEASLERQRARVEALETELFDAWSADGSAADNTRAELTAAQATLERLRERVSALEVRAHTDGRVALPEADDLSGQFVRRGRLLGQVLGADAGTVRVALPESEAIDLQSAERSAGVRLASAPGVLLRGTLVRDAVGATMLLPSAALSARHGGDIQTDPKDDLKPLKPVVLLDLQLDSQTGDGARLLGHRAWVRFDTGFAPLALQAGRALHRQVLQRFNPQF